jgi:hypothetical protein
MERTKPPMESFLFARAAPPMAKSLEATRVSKNIARGPNSAGSLSLL